MNATDDDLHHLRCPLASPTPLKLLSREKRQTLITIVRTETMAEAGGITELQQLQAEAALLEKTLAGVKKGEPTSKACARIIASIKASEAKDGFLVQEDGMMAGGAHDHSMYTSAQGGGEGGCCTVM